MSKYVLLTGATGLLGQYLLRDLLLDGQRVAVLVRRKGEETAKSRIESIMQEWEARLDRQLPRPICFEGDIREDGLGLEDEDKNWLAEHCDRVLHNAAAVSFHTEEENGEPWLSNLQGTRNTLDLCHELNIHDFHYVSTAYVCGIRDGLVMESDLEADQDFRNDYENSKLQAEQLVRSADFLDHLTVYRPAVIAGDSQTGFTSTYHGLCMYLKLMSVLMHNIEPNEEGLRPIDLRLKLTGEERRNIIPLDWVSAVICHLMGTPEAFDRTYHLTPETPITPREIIDHASSYFNGGGVEYCGSDVSYEELNEFERMIHDNMAMYESYNSTDPQFDTSNLKKYAPHLPCPVIDEAMLHRFIRYGEEDRWGKRKPQSANVERWAEELLPTSDQLVATVEAMRSLGLQEEDQNVIGLDVFGNGGGQWQLTLCGDRILEIEAGLPAGSEPVVRLNCEELQRLIQTGKRPQERAETAFTAASSVETGEASMLNPVTLLARALRPAQDDAPAQVI